MSGKLFTQEMREATRSIHNKSDTMVNAKLGVTISDDSVWAEGLLVFYEIFKFLEEALERHSESLIGDLLIPGLNRTEAFEADLDHYLGESWSENYKMRPEVENYLRHLRKIEEENPYRLVAYVYHLYMGLFSGGQILRAKRLISLSPAKSDSSGANVTSYGDISIGSLKKQLRAATNSLAENLDEQNRQAILEEGVKVFELNNTIIASVKGVDAVLKRRLLKLLIAVLLLLLIFLPVIFYSGSSEAGSETETRFNLDQQHTVTKEL